MTVGGSSGGGATALASGMLPLAEGTDFGGSFRSASAPCGHTAAGLPIGLQIIGLRFAEPKILAAAKFVHEMNPTEWPDLAVSAKPN